MESDLTRDILELGLQHSEENLNIGQEEIKFPEKISIIGNISKNFQSSYPFATIFHISFQHQDSNPKETQIKSPKKKHQIKSKRPIP